MPTIRVLLLVSVMAATAGSALAAGPSARVHSSAGTTQAAGLAVSQLDVITHPMADGRVRVHAHLRVRNTTSQTKRRSLQIGSCVAGPPSAPICPRAASRSVVVPARTTRSFILIAAVRHPPASIDAIQVTLSAPGLRAPIGRHSDAFVLVGSRAWASVNAGRRFGVDLTPNGAHALTGVFWDLPALDPNAVYMSLKWTGIAPTAATTSLLRCVKRCTATQLHPQRARSGPKTFDTRVVQHRLGAEYAVVQIAQGQRQLASLTLPWPR